jgi:heterotetrameric sarcosine oxidase gamma subunit
VVQRLTGNAAIRPGKVFSIDENERLIVCCLAADQLLLLGATASISTVKSLNVDQDPSIEQQDVTCGLAGVHLIGPKVDELLRRLVPLDVSASTFPAGSCAETSCAGIHGTIVRGTEFEVPAMRIYVSWDYGEYLWERLIDAGRDLGVTPVGIEAWQALIKTGERPA